MAKKIYTFFLFLSLTANVDCFSQKTLKIVFTRFGQVKRYDIHVDEMLEYKLKGQFFYHQNKIVNLEDSFIVFSNDEAVELNQLKVVRVNRGNYVITKFRKFFIRGGLIFFVLNTFNNNYNHIQPVIDEKAALIATGLIGTGLILREMGLKRIRITKRKYLKIVDLGFNNLSGKPEK